MAMAWTASPSTAASGSRTRASSTRPGWIFGGCGGAVAYRRAMLDQVGLFDESFFMYCEDVDLNWRSQLAGWRCWYTPEAVVYHKLSATGGGPIASYYTGRNTAVGHRQELSRRAAAQDTGRASCAPSGPSARDALRAWRGQAARARLRGQLAGLLGLAQDAGQAPGDPGSAASDGRVYRGLLSGREQGFDRSALDAIMNSVYVEVKSCADRSSPATGR